MPLKSGEMSGLFPITLKSARQIMINQAVELTKLLTDQEEYDYIRLGETLKLSLEDLVILNSDKQKLEKAYGFQDNEKKVKIVNSVANIDDFYIEELPNGHTKFSYHGKEYVYGKVQSAIISSCMMRPRMGEFGCMVRLCLRMQDHQVFGSAIFSNRTETGWKSLKAITKDSIGYIWIKKELLLFNF